MFQRAALLRMPSKSAKNSTNRTDMDRRNSERITVQANLKQHLLHRTTNGEAGKAPQAERPLSLLGEDSWRDNH